MCPPYWNGWCCRWRALVRDDESVDEIGLRPEQRARGQLDLLLTITIEREPFQWIAFLDESSSETEDHARSRLASELQDFIAESRFSRASCARTRSEEEHVDLSDQELYDRLLDTLAAGSSIETDGEADVVSIFVFEGLELDPAMRLHLDPQTVGRTVREIAASSYVQPGMDPVASSIGLFLLHIEEAVHTARDGETELKVVSYGVESYRPDGTKTPFAPEVGEYIALNDFHERLIEHYADRGEMEIDSQHEILILHDLDGHTYRPPLRVQVTSAEMRAQLRASDDHGRYWRTVVEAIDRLALTTDSRDTMIALTPDGVVTRPLSAPLPTPDAGFGWSAHAPESGTSYP